MLENGHGMSGFIGALPKAELHLHIEGTLEPELMFKLAERNCVKLNQRSVGEIKKAYNFHNLQDFLDIYYEGTGVLATERDFYELCMAYLDRAKLQNIVHVEIFFDPQTHMRNGVPFDIVVKGLHRALSEARERYGISSSIIMCFLRHLDEGQALEVLEEAARFKRWIRAVGLDSSEVGNPPSKFRKVFDAARSEGFLAVAHAGEEGPASYVRQAIKLLGVSRIDHGNNAVKDPALMAELARRRVPLTMCPISNLKLRVVKNLKDYPLRRLMSSGVVVTLNSDDPAYFGGYLNDNYIALSDALRLIPDELYTLARNSFEASFLSDRDKAGLVRRLDSAISDYALSNPTDGIVRR